MTDKSNPTTRRTILIGAAALTGLPLLAQPKQAHAAGGVKKENVHFQNMPKGAAQCSKCNYFVAGASATAVGQCKVVAGPIPPNGWCQLYAAKHA